MLARGQQLMGQLAVIRQQQQSFRILIQSADRKRFEQRVLRLEQIQHRPVPFIFGCRQNSSRFIHHQINIFTVADRLPRHFDFVLVRVYMITAVLDYRPVHGNQSLLRLLADFAAGADAHMGQHFIDPLLLSGSA
ncbi:hypothetical protein D3C73_1145360 [compost metagenome]